MNQDCCSCQNALKNVLMTQFLHHLKRWICFRSAPTHCLCELCNILNRTVCYNGHCYFLCNSINYFYIAMLHFTAANNKELKLACRKLLFSTNTLINVVFIPATDLQTPCHTVCITLSHKSILSQNHHASFFLHTVL